MSGLARHLYVVVYPNEALIASQLTPEEFGLYYSVGSSRYYSGKMLFFELDLDFRHPFFPIEDYLGQTVEHPDGSPKQTKFISSYRVLEHLDCTRIQALYAVTGNGQTLRLEKSEQREFPDAGLIRIYQELNPVHMLICATMDPATFGAYVCSPKTAKGAPRLLYTQLELDVEGFLAQWKVNPFLSPPLPGVHPQKLAEVLEVMKSDDTPRTKSIGIQSIFDRIHYGRVRHGFWLAGCDELHYFRLPDEKELHDQHYGWWKAR